MFIGRNSEKNRVRRLMKKVDRETSKYILAYRIAAAVTSAIGLICSIVCFFGTKEVNTSAYGGEEDNEDRSLKGFFRTTRQIFSFKPYLLHMGFFMFLSLGIQFCQSNLALFVTYTIKMTNYLNYGIMSLLLVTILLIPFAQLLLKKIGKKCTSSISILNAYPLLLTIYFMPEKPHLAVFFFMMVWFSVTLSIAMLLPWSMFPDVIDAIFGYNSTENCNQPPSVGQALRFLSSVVPIAFLIPSLLCLCYYPLNNTAVTKIRAEKLGRAESPYAGTSRSNSVNKFE
ncbi:hypothetical protein ACTXT7_016259, partial [Hymenolepis weldensis]